MKHILRSIFIACLLAAVVQAGTITGTVTSTASGPVVNGAFTFTLTQPAVLAGTATITAQSVSCYTDANGNVVGEPNPLAGPVVTSNLASGTLVAGTYFVRLTYQDATGETIASPETAFTMTGPGTLIVNAPVVQPAGATTFRVYISTTSGAEKLQGSVSVSPGSWGNYSQTSALAAGIALPTSNSTACKLAFNDQLQPSFTGYNVALTSQSGAIVPGYPQLWYLLGGSNGTINLSNGTPLYSGISAFQFPQAIVSNPAAAGLQSINGPLSIGGSLSVGAAASGPASINGVLHVGGAISSTDIGVQINAAYVACTGGSCHIIVDPSTNGNCYNFSTPVAFTTLGKYVLLEGAGGTSNTGTAVTGACLNYIPTNATTAITMDYASNGAQGPVHGLRNIHLVNNGCVTTGGCGSSAAGISNGTTNTGATGAIFDNVGINGFGIGVNDTNTNQGFTFTDVTWLNPQFIANTTAMQLNVPTGFVLLGGTIAGNGAAIRGKGAASTPEIELTGVQFFGNAGLDIDFTNTTINPNGAASLYCHGCHFERTGGNSSHSINGAVDLYFYGGVIEDDNSSGTGDWFINSGGFHIFIDGMKVASGRPLTTVIVANSPTRGKIEVFSPGTGTSTLVTGTNASKFTQLLRYPGTLGAQTNVIEGTIAPAGVAVNSDTVFTASPRLQYTCYIQAYAGSNRYCRFSVEKPVTVVSVHVASQTPPANCITSPQFGFQSVPSASVTNPNGQAFVDNTGLNISIPAGSYDIGTVNTDAGCSTQIGAVTLTIQYKMQ
ncbi:MAG TPA: hypothetical protein VKZ53_18505 [Candidatus Angelobacter sp.]|nr:hypothetical protein [Candidatus Angelobacter sp.]